MKNKVVLLLFIVCSAWTATAQTIADSLALVAAHWQVTSLKKGVLCRKAFFNSLYGVPQEVSVLEITPKYYNLDVLIHQPKEETSVAAHRSGAIAAVNGSYFNMKAGNSVCYLRKNGGGYNCQRRIGYGFQWSCIHKERTDEIVALEQTRRKGLSLEAWDGACFRSFDADEWKRV